jgi:hypothetical protein
MECDLCGKDICEEGRGILIKLYYRKPMEQGNEYIILKLCARCFAKLLSGAMVR